MKENIGNYLQAMRGYIEQVLKDAYPTQTGELREDAVRDAMVKAISYWHTQNNPDRCFDTLEVRYEEGRIVSKVKVNKENAGWLAMIAKNEMKNRIKKDTERRLAEDYVEEGMANDSVSPETLVYIDQVLWGGYTPLQEDIRDNYLLGGESLIEIADRRGISYNYVKLECSRLRAQMKQNLGVK